MNNSKNILIVEDEQSIADALIYSIEQESFSYNHFSNIQDARSFLSTKPRLDLIILDIGLPDGSGLEFCKEIREEIDTPIFFLTARNDEIDRVLGLEIGADDYITKPFSPRELMARVKSLFRRIKKLSHETKVKEVLNFGPFAIDSERFQIFFNEDSINLSLYEYRILKLLLEKQERVLSRGQIMEMAWDEPDMSLERTIDAHIKSIRKKIKTFDQKTDYITTHRGIGYSFIKVKA